MIGVGLSLCGRKIGAQVRNSDMVDFLGMLLFKMIFI